MRPRHLALKRSRPLKLLLASDPSPHAPRRHAPPKRKKPNPLGNRKRVLGKGEKEKSLERTKRERLAVPTVSLRAKRSNLVCEVLNRVEYDPWANRAYRVFCRDISPERLYKSLWQC